MLLQMNKQSLFTFLLVVGHMVGKEWECVFLFNFWEGRAMLKNHAHKASKT
jgi:hypothetical protein